MERVIDFLAEEELKAAEQFVEGHFSVKPARQCRLVIDKHARKARKINKHVRMVKLVQDLILKAEKGNR